MKNISVQRICNQLKKHWTISLVTGLFLMGNVEAQQYASEIKAYLESQK